MQISRGHVISPPVIPGRLSHPGRRRDLAITLIIAGFSALVAAVLVMTDGNIMAAAAIPVAFAIIALTVLRLDWGFLVFAGLVLSLDQYILRGFDPVTFRISYFLNLKEITFLPTYRVDAAMMNPLELHLMLLFIVWLLRAAVRKEFDLRGGSVWFAALTFLFWIVISFIWGRARGGEFLPALWELRALCYFGIVYFFTPQVIQSKKQVESLMWVCIFAITFKAIQGIGRFVALGFNSWGYDELTNSEDPVFMVTLIFLLLALALLHTHQSQRKALWWLLPVLLMGIYVGERRASYASLLLTAIGFAMILRKRELRTYLKGASVVALLLTLYLVLFWNSYGRIGLVAQQFKSAMIRDPSVISGRDYLSNLYREYENYNLSYTIRNSPLLGLGFGHMYENPLSYYGMERRGILGYIPHNGILWLFAKTGSVGFFLFFFFLDAYLFRCGRAYSSLKDPYLKAICAMIIIAIINQIIVASVEMQLTYYRNMIYLGILMGLLPTLVRIDATANEKAVAIV